MQFICLVTLAATLALGLRFVWEARVDESAERAELQRITHEAAAQIDQILKPVEPGHHRAGGPAHARRRSTPRPWSPRCRPWCRATRPSSAARWPSDPMAAMPAPGSYAPYATRNAPAGGPQPTQLGDDYDYTVADAGPDALTDWYVRPMREGGQDGWARLTSTPRWRRP
ncbi:MAG: hypothetical protein MZW92_34675 [Comamonadaceae bacterium]|nr:hypothetical protein [Comamonadaceae bacterium]